MSENQTTVVEQSKKSTLGNRFTQAGIVAGTALMVSPAFAALSTEALETEIASNSASMQTVMLAVLTLVALFVGYRMIKRSMS